MTERDRLCALKVTQSEINVIIAVAENEGKLDAVASRPASPSPWTNPHYCHTWTVYHSRINTIPPLPVQCTVLRHHRSETGYQRPGMALLRPKLHIAH